MTSIKKIKDFFLRVWRDPVWSKVISVGILGLIGLFWAKLTHHSWKEVYSFVISILSFKLPIYLFLSVIALYVITIKLIQLFKKKKDSFWDQQMGNYTFKELHNILLTTEMPLRTTGMKISGQLPPSENFLSLFQVYYIFLNKGVGIEDNLHDGGYLYSVFAPRMVGFGLVDEYQEPVHNLLSAPPNFGHKN